jgi:hypothetical protein
MPFDGWPLWNTQEGRLWMQDMQLYTIAAAALFLLCAAAFRGAPVLPVLVGAVLLVAADAVVIRAHLLALSTLPWLVAGGLLVGMAVWSVAPRLGRSSISWLRGHRLVILVAVLAAYLAPGAYFGKVFQVPGAPTPPVLLLVIVGVPPC